MGSEEGIALRCALGLALCAHAAFALGVIGQLRPVPIIALLVLVVVGSALRRTERRLPAGSETAGRVPALLKPAAFAAVAALLFILALYPPFAFDETLYHLPFVRAFAASGALQIVPDSRFPVFPVLHELLCVPAFLLAGDVGTHLVALAEVLIAAAVIVEWAGHYDRRAGWLAAAMFLGSPLVVELSTVLYVDIALTLFVAAGFYALDRRRYALAGLFFGSACGVKYLALFFALFALVLLLVRRTRFRSVAAFAGCCAATALPMTGWIFAQTHDPLFPFLRPSLWTLPATAPIGFGEHALRFVRALWDATFARQRIGFEPPVTPFLLAFVALVVAAALPERGRPARWSEGVPPSHTGGEDAAAPAAEDGRAPNARALLLLGAVYLAVFTFLPQDSRYLVPLLPLISVVAAIVVATRWPRAVTIAALIAIAPGIAYAGYRIARQGVPPVTMQERSDWIERRLPGARALRLAGARPVYACGAERLKSYAGGRFLGDYNGPYAYSRILNGANDTRAIAERLRAIGVEYFLVVKCERPRDTGGMELVDQDAGAQLWKLLRR